jgi:tetratricopeptide (TPR) repeat protein
MSRSITQYRVFIATPGGLDDERRFFRKTLEDYTASDAEPRGITFHPVGWEDTLGGIGRPQELINEDLRQCDYAVFVWHVRWGSPTGNGTMVGTEEEWNVAEELFKTLQVRNIAVFFKKVDESRLRDPGPQLKQVLAHKKRIEKEKRYLFKSYDQPDTFRDELRKYLAQWPRDHEKGADRAAIGDLATASGPKITSVVPPPATPEAPPPNFRFWIQEVDRLLKTENSELGNYSDALYCVRKALAVATSYLEWAEATNIKGVCQLRLNSLADALASFSEIVTRFEGATDPDRRYWLAEAAFSNGKTPFQLGRNEDALSAYEDVITRFGTEGELRLREVVAKALISKGLALSALGRSEEGIAVYDGMIARFGAASELALRKQVAHALGVKGLTLGAFLGRAEEEIAVDDEVIARFGADEDPALKAIVEDLKKRRALRTKA